ncbi:MAG: hypothetical protein JEZ04_10825 [Spirochaetales bacterium]|nr:hypothetical protein [Spirochaetales bacterium]
MSDLKQEPDKNLIPDADEISLVDLLVVILRRRRLILGLTLAAVVIGTALVLILPTLKYQKSLEIEALQDENRYEVSLTCALAPSALYFGSSKQFEEIVFLTIKDPVVLSKSLEANNIVDITDVVLKNVTNDGNGLFTMSVIMDSGDMAKRFLDTILSEVNIRLSELLYPSLQAEIQNYEEFIKLDYSSKVDESDLVTAFYRYKAAGRITSGNDNVLTPVLNREKPVAVGKIASLTSIRNNLITKVIIAVAAVFLLSIFLAFILQAIENVRKDPVSVSKLRRALGKEK